MEGQEPWSMDSRTVGRLLHLQDFLSRLLELRNPSDDICVAALQVLKDHMNSALHAASQ
jgi:hypothetical protein